MTDAAPQQLPLGLTLPRRRARGRGAFAVSASNIDALTMIDGWHTWPDRRLALFGDAGAGKTHLAHVWMEDAGAEKVAARMLTADDVPLLITARAVVVEDGDRAAGDKTAEHALFHLLNLAAAEQASVLLTGRTAPARWAVATPDLRSRLSAITAIEIGAPDEALMRDILIRQFADRHLKVDPGVIAFLVARLPRTAAAATDAAATLDKAALASQRKITVPFVKEITRL